MNTVKHGQAMRIKKPSTKGKPEYTIKFLEVTLKGLHKNCLQEFLCFVLRTGRVSRGTDRLLLVSSLEELGFQ